MSLITWTWNTEYQLTTAVQGNGQVVTTNSAWQPAGTGHTPEGARGKRGHFASQHTGLPKTPKAPGSPRAAKPGKPRPGKGRPHKHINPGSPTGAGKRRGAR